MRRRLRLVALIALFTLFSMGVFPRAPSQASAAPRGSGRTVAREVTLPAPALNGGALSVSAGVPAGAAAALAIGSTGGGTLLYTSPAIAAEQLFDHIGLHWVVQRGTDASVSLELRTSRDGVTWTSWATAASIDDMYDPDRGEQYAAPQLASAGARFAQYRAWLAGGDASALVRVGITFMDVTDLNAGPLTTLLNDVRGAIASFGESYAAAAPVGAPKIYTRQDWGADESLMQWIPEYRPVQKAIVHHTAGDDGGTNVAATIRAIYYFHAVTRGWGDIGYNFLVDKYGNVWMGRAGGDNVVGGHAYGWNYGSMGVASIGTYTTTAPWPALLGAVANIIAIKFSQYGLQPYGADPFTHQEQRSDGTWVPVTSSPPNIQGHRDANYIVGQNGGQTECPGGALYAQLPTVRSMAQNAVQNGYTNLVRLDPALPKAGLAGSVIPVATTVTNVGRTAIPAGTAVSYRILLRGTMYVAQGGQAQLAAPIAPGASASVTVPFTVPAIGSYAVRWDLETANTWWNALYNQPYRDMWFRSAEWSADWVTDNVPKTWFAGQTSSVTVTVSNDGGRPWNAAGVDPVMLGYRWIDDASGVVTTGTNFTSLAADVLPGQTVTLSIPVTAPVASANYVMELDLVKQAEFWFKDKGIPADPTPIGVGLDFHATYQVGAVPAIGIGQTVAVAVTVTNTGQGTFPTLTTRPVDLAYHWYDPTGKTVVWDGLRTKLPADLATGQMITLQAQVQSPPDGGTYSLRFDLVQEGVSWFSAKGVPTGNAQVTVCCAKTFGATYQPQITTLAVTGALQTVPMAVTNSGNFTWNAGGANPVDLGYHWVDSAGRTVVWDGLRTKLAADVAPGGSQTLQAAIQFPTAPGTYTLRWDLVQEGVAWFSSQGVRTYDQLVGVGAAVTPFYGGSFDVSATARSLPTSMTSQVSLKVQNLSNFDWGPNVNLSYHWSDAGRTIVWDGARTALSGMRVNEVRTITAQVAAPAAPGTYTLEWDIVQEGVAWFSDRGMQTPAYAVTVTVPAYGATYSVPATLAAAANATITVPVTVTNTGSITWQAGLGFNLAYHLYTTAGATYVWDGLRTALPATLATGQSVTVNATVRLPASAGSYTLRFDMVQEGTTWFSGRNVPMSGSTLAAQ